MKKSIIVLLLCLVFASMLFIYGCGNVTGGGSSGGGGVTGSPWIYCGNREDNTISIIDGTSLEVAGSIEIDSYTPMYIAASPNGDKLYVSTYTSTILQIDTATNTIVGTFDVGETAYRGMVVSNDGKYLYVSGTAHVVKVDLKSPTKAYESFFPYTLGCNAPYNITCNGDSSKIYIPQGDGMMSSAKLHIENAAATAIATADTIVNDQPRGLTVNNGKIYWLTTGSKAHYWVVNLSSNSITNVMTSDAAIMQDVIAIPNTNKIYTSYGDSVGEIKIIDSTVPTIESTNITTADADFSHPNRMAVTADGTRVFVHTKVLSGSNPSKIYVIDTATDNIIKNILIGNSNGSNVVHDGQVFRL